MSISDVLNIATSGLTTAQAQVAATSDNIANVNTVGFARKVVSQSETIVDGKGLGVHIDAITRASNAFLQKASLLAASQSSQASVVSDFMDRAQQMFGDPSSSTSFFAGLDSLYSAFSSASDTPSSSLSRTGALSAVSDFLKSSSNLSTNLSNLRDDANHRTAADVAEINDILKQISQSNNDISRIAASGGDASGSLNQQSLMLDRLSTLMQVQVSPNGTGGVALRSQDGIYLAGDQGAATVSFSTVGGGGMLTATPPKGQPMQITAGGGEIAGLMHLAGVDIPQMASQLSEFVSQAVSQINAAHNASTAVPPPNSLVGVATGQDITTAIGNFSGKTTVAITNAAGVMQQRVDITFGFGTGQMNVTDNLGATSTINFTPATFLADLNTALGTQGYATYSNGVLTVGANSGSNGVAIADDATTPSVNNGQGFSQFFGLNNLIQTSGYATVTGSLGTASPNTLSGAFSLELTDAKGAALRQINLTIPATAVTVGDVLNALNANIGAYGQFALDGQNHVAFTPTNGYAGTTASVITDATSNSAGGPTITQLLGIGWNSQSARTPSFSVRTDIAANPSKLALAQMDLTQAVNGAPALAVGDGRGAVAIANSGSINTVFSAAGAIKATTNSVSGYAAELSGQIGAAATAADNRAKSATALATQATAQRSAAEGVNLDTELVNLTTYQQSYNACARLIQASKDMYDTLLQIV
jgi:flagellar hook-associated protein 1 FlgK